ncbi:hypothetical protein, partial [Burkholderia contaminans]
GQNGVAGANAATSEAINNATNPEDIAHGKDLIPLEGGLGNGVGGLSGGSAGGSMTTGEAAAAFEKGVVESVEGTFARIENLGQAISDKITSVWNSRPFARGVTIEQNLGQNLPPNMPVIDRFENGIATSIKSLDVNATSYQNTSTLTRTVNGYIDKVAAYNGTSQQGW